jgi:myosin heavy subunit
MFGPRHSRFWGTVATSLVVGLLGGAPALADDEAEKKQLVDDATTKVSGMNQKQAEVEQKLQDLEVKEPDPEKMKQLTSLISSMGTMVGQAGEALEDMRDANTSLDEMRTKHKYIDEQATQHNERYGDFQNDFNVLFNAPQQGVKQDGAQKPEKSDLFEDAGPDIPVSEYVPQAESMLTEMRTELSKVLDQLARARQAKDAVKLNYVNEQVTTMKGILRISEDAFINLQEAISSNALEKARYEFGKIRVSHRKMKELAAAVANAKGAEASYTGGTDVQLEVDQAVVGGDPYYGNQEFFNAPQSGVVDSGDDGVGAEDQPDARPQPASPT